ncbi:MAG: hypothetical protein Q8Q26_18905 [Pseudorhodobacter sp.]|nr:hypothetical protein [Pseudorhodobacter sp.]
MAVETVSDTLAPPPPRPSLFVECDEPLTYAGADAIICAVPEAWDAARQDAWDDDAASTAIIWRWTPGRVLPEGARVAVVEGGLALAASVAATDAGLVVVPRVEVRHSARRYGFAAGQSSSSFVTYHLDPATARSLVVAEPGQPDMALDDWLKRAQDQGFAEVWLHSTATATAEGFSNDLLTRANRAAPGVHVWLSASGKALSHFETVTALPGLAALVLAAAEFAETDPETGGQVAATDPPRNLSGAA